jgi:hypothetical protein
MMDKISFLDAVAIKKSESIVCGEFEIGVIL